MSWQYVCPASISELLQQQVKFYLYLIKSYRRRKMSQNHPSPKKTIYQSSGPTDQVHRVERTENLGAMSGARFLAVACPPTSVGQVRLGTLVRGEMGLGANREDYRGCVCMFGVACRKEVWGFQGEEPSATRVGLLAGHAII